MSTVGLRKLETMILWLSSTRTWVLCASLPTDGRFLDGSVDWINLLIESEIRWNHHCWEQVVHRFLCIQNRRKFAQNRRKFAHRSPTYKDETLVGQLESHQWNAYGARDLPLSISLRLQHVPPLFGVHGPGAPPGIKKPSWQNPWGKSMFSHHCLSATKLGFWLLLLLFAAWILLQLQMDSNKRWATHYSKNERNCSFVLCWRLR